MKGPDSRRCTALLSDRSRRCRNRAIRGGTVCRKHGGAAPQVQKSARQRLAELVEPALVALRLAFESGDVMATLRAAQLVLDRCGLGPRSTIELEEATPRPEPPVWVPWATPDELREIRTLIDKAEARRDAGEPPKRRITTKQESSNAEATT